MGLAAGAAAAGLLEYRDSTLKTDADVLVALSLPVLALVPRMQSAAERYQRRRRRLILSLTSAATVLVVAIAAFAVWKLTVRS